MHGGAPLLSRWSGPDRNLFVLNRFAPGTAPESGRPFTERRVRSDHRGPHRVLNSSMDRPRVHLRYQVPRC